MTTSSFGQWLTNLETDIENAVTTTEADIQIWVAKIQSGLGVVESDLSSGLKWVAANAPAWVSALQSIVALAQLIPGLQIPAAAIEATAAAAAALTAIAASETAGKTNGATLVSAYNAVVNAQAAHASVLQAVTSAPTPAVPVKP